MKLYPKKLDGIRDLELEKARLLLEKKQLQDEPFLSLSGVKNAHSGGGLSALLDFIPVSSPFLRPIVNMIKKRLARNSDDHAQSLHNNGTSKKKHKGKAAGVAKDVVGGYLMLKATELAIKGVSHFIKSRRDKKKAAAAAADGHPGEYRY
jgi:hypothetical protein